MHTVTSRDFQRNLGHYQDEALKEPVAITHHGRRRLVLISADEYQQLVKRARTALPVSGLPEHDIEMIRKTTVSDEHNHLDAELESETV